MSDAGDDGIGAPFLGGDGDSNANQVGGICCKCCCGVILLPLMLYFTAWNEMRSVCRDKALYEAEDHVHDLSCSSLAGDYKSGDLGFLSCDLDRSTFHRFTSQNFPGLQGMPDLFPDGTESVSMSMTTEMLVCVETCTREVCTRRLRGVELNSTEGSVDLGASETETEEEEMEEEPIEDDDEGSTEDAIALSSSRRRSCTRHCVEWDYNLQWSATEGVSYFHDPGQAQYRCGDSSNPTMSNSHLTLGTSYAYAQEGTIKAAGDFWSLNRWQEEGLPIDLNIDPTPTGFNTSWTVDYVQPPIDLDRGNSGVFGQYLTSCVTGQERLGCVRATFMRGAPEHVTMLGKISAKPGMFDPDGWLAPEDWICKGWDINRICPMSPISGHVDLYKGYQSCEADLTKEELFDTMHNENQMTAWGYRVIAWLGLWWAVSCCLSPIKDIVSVMTQFADQITECIPGVGWVIDFLTDIVDSVVSCVVCCVSFFCASSCFCVVAGVAWLALRPLYGITFLTFSCCCFCCASGLCYMGRKSMHNKE